MPDLISTAETARRLGFNRATVARLAGSGELPYAQKMQGIRGAYLFDPITVARWARQNGRILKAAS